MVATSDAATWLRQFHPGAEQAPRLITFPHAGGSASYYFMFSRAFGSSARVSVVQYPGRQDRRQEPFAADLRGLAADIVEAIVATDDGAPLVLFGHSMGALIAFEVAVQLCRRGGPLPVELVVSGRRSPTKPKLETVHQRDDQGLLRELRVLNGTGAMVLEDQELLDLIVPPLRADYRLLEQYRYEPGTVLELPVTALVGDRDPRTSVDDADQWSNVTTGEFNLHVLPGGHFYLADQLPEVAELVGDRLARIPSPLLAER